MARFRHAFLLLVAVILATGPALSALAAAAPAAHSHAAMTMSDGGGDDVCCDHSIPDDNTVCAAHCAAGIIAASMVFVPSEAVSTSVAAVFILPSASHAPVPDIAPPKSSAA